MFSTSSSSSPTSKSTTNEQPASTYTPASSPLPPPHPKRAFLFEEQSHLKTLCAKSDARCYAGQRPYTYLELTVLMNQKIKSTYAVNFSIWLFGVQDIVDEIAAEWQWYGREGQPAETEVGLGELVRSREWWWWPSPSVVTGSPSTTAG
ncbi:hypothetical protein MBM_08659 [Drepanopeziza brunnea f. sp. 'multigermtubi' MB_m1]|uniref:Uncharacterized protein n=1 Tax=Marssonina brunnea f. sp. multigermtubi (strain MB_m1) TaxID=1072389 RepID=K1WK40_MARBU|nr:uncharacterized protein MBM_08659 [Drepanopeziza brunnea f. sp. 'multigermtubi' MB_m1]EKD13216.1 hypothetical protein MBM_08659 [Drepanopeziza brunnea f. sp. 'multigermtubi' MB_m1]